MRFKALLFDLGGTLWDFKDESARETMRYELGKKFIDVMSSYGIEVRWDAMFIGSAIGNALWTAELYRYYTTGIPPSYSDVVKAVAQYWIPDLADNQIDWQHVFDMTYVPESNYKRPFDDTIEALEILRSMGIKMIVVSNRIRGGERFAREWTENISFSKYFDGYVLSCDLGFMKPRREIFEEALRIVEASPHEAAMIGDLLRADVLGANMIGMTSIWINRSGKRPTYTSVKPDFEIASLLELPDIVMGKSA